VLRNAAERLDGRRVEASEVLTIGRTLRLVTGDPPHERGTQGRESIRGKGSKRACDQVRPAPEPNRTKKTEKGRGLGGGAGRKK